MGAVSGIEPIRGWIPEWYRWTLASGSAGKMGRARLSPGGQGDGGEGDGGSDGGEEKTIHRKPTANERIPMDLLLLSNNGEICG